MERTLPASDWDWFEHDDGLFALAYPKRWPQVPAVSKGAALSCAAGDGSVLLEVLCLHSDKYRSPHEPHLVDVVADGVAEIAPKDKGMSGGRLIERREVARRSSGKCVRVVVSYREKGLDFTTDYFIAGVAQDVVYVALKSRTASFAANRALFEEALKTLRTPWLAETGFGAAPGGRHPVSRQ